MKRMLFSLPFFLILIFCTKFASIAGEPGRPTNIYPGEGIGPVKLEDTMEKVLDALKWGEPDIFKKQENDYYLFYTSKKVAFAFAIQPSGLAKSRLKRITVSSPAFSVYLSGIRVGDNYNVYKENRLQMNIKQAHLIDKCKEMDKEKSNENTTRYRCNGMDFLVSRKTGIIEAIEIFKP